MKILFKLILGFIITTTVLDSCAPALTPIPTATSLPPTASPTHTATATPSPTPTITATLTPSPEQIAEELNFPAGRYSIESGKLIDKNGTVWAHQDENKNWVGEFVYNETWRGIPDVWTKDIYTKTSDMNTVSEDKIPGIRSMPITKNEYHNSISIADLLLTQVRMSEVVAKDTFSTYVAILTFAFKSGSGVHQVTFEAVEDLYRVKFEPDNFPLTLGQCYQVIAITPNKKIEPGEYFRLTDWGSGSLPTEF